MAQANFCSSNSIGEPLNNNISSSIVNNDSHKTTLLELQWILSVLRKGQKVLMIFNYSISYLYISVSLFPEVH